MDPVLALAILSLGAFLTVLVTALFYTYTVRPNLLAPASSTGVDDPALSEELAEQRGVMDRLNQSLTHHTQQLAQSASRSTSELEYVGLQQVLAQQTDVVRSLARLLDQQSVQLNGLDTRLSRQETYLSQVGTQPDNTILVAQLTNHSTQLDRLEARLDSIDTRLSAAPSSDVNRIGDLIQTQADALVAVSKRLDDWAAAIGRSDEKMLEHARILAELDREIAAQAQVAQRLDTKVNEHTTMLVTAAAERREQATILDKVVYQLGQILQFVGQAAKPVPRPAVGQDRLTDINGIGPVYASKLYEVGVYTFRQLSEMKPEDIQVLLNIPEWRWKRANVPGWIEQASHFAAQRDRMEE